MKEFVEFKTVEGGKLSVRPSYITTVGETNAGNVFIGVEDGQNYDIYDLDEPYEQVVAKIEAAEQGDFAPVVEHFTHEQYAVLLSAVDYRMKNDPHYPAELALIAGTLAGIIKGEE